MGEGLIDRIPPQEDIAIARLRACESGDLVFQVVKYLRHGIRVGLLKHHDPMIRSPNEELLKIVVYSTTVTPFTFKDQGDASQG